MQVQAVENDKSYAVKNAFKASLKSKRILNELEKTLEKTDLRMSDVPAHVRLSKSRQLSNLKSQSSERGPMKTESFLSKSREGLSPEEVMQCKLVL